jgi:NDP-sugar pyrophosphorylase family protein
VPLTAVILAAGAGTRLGELGKRHSKPTVPVAGRPLIEWVLAMLTAAGVQRFVVVGHPTDTRLAEIVATLPDAILVEQPQRRGIADALHHAVPQLAGEAAYLACACDSLYRASEVRRVIAVGEAHRGEAVIGVFDMGVAATASRSAVRVDGDRVVEIVEKPTAGSAVSGIVALPLYWLPSSFHPYVGSDHGEARERYVSTALDQFLQAGGNVRAVAMTARLEITTAEDVAQAEARRQEMADWVSDA